MDKKKSCNCLNDCPCYPNCDQMMKNGKLPGMRPPIPPEPPTEPWSQMPPKPPMGPGPQMPPKSPVRPGRTPLDFGQVPQTIPGMPKPDIPIGYWRMPAAGMSISLEEENERDWQKLKEQYPDMAKIILAEVENICDSMEYEGSMMFDSMPDKVRVRKLTDNIYEKVKDRYPVEEMVDQDDVFVMNQEGRRRYPPRQNWMSDFIQVLLYQEMFRRRCRHRGCKRW